MLANINCQAGFRLNQVLIALMLFVFSLGTANGQSLYPTDGSTPMGLKPGSPAGSYSLSGFDNINLYNGNLNFRLPLLSIGGRGSAGHTIMLPIEQHWQVETVKVQMDDYWQTFYYPSNDWWEVKGPGYGPGVMHARYGVFGTRYCSMDGMTRAFRTRTLLTFTAADGTEYELRDRLTGGGAAVLTPCASYGRNRGKVFVTADGSSATFVSDADIIDPHLSDGSSWTDTEVSGYLILADGSRSRISFGRVEWMRDRNGNKVSFAYGGYGVSTITDSLNRQVTIDYNVAEGGPYGTCDKITYKGFGGASRLVRICKTSLGNVLRSGYVLQTEVQLFGMGSPYGNFNPTVVSAVWLPDSDGVTRRYQFRYNSYGELARVELPTGGAVEYDHAGGMAGDLYNSGVISDAINYAIYRRVIERREYADGLSLTNRTTYARPDSHGGSTLGYVTVDQMNSTGTLLVKQKHYFYGIGAARSILQALPVFYPLWDEGKEYQAEAFDTNGTTVLRRTQHTWQGNGTMGGQTINPRITETVTTIEPSGANLVSKKTFTHDQYNNVTDAYEYDFGSGAAGSLVRRTQTTYVTTNNGYDYACDATSTCSASLNLSNVIHLRRLVAQTSVYDAGGLERARSTNEYDNYATDSNHAALTNRASISGLDAAFTTSYTTRGNSTGTTRYLLLNGSVTGSISAYAQFDVAGNAVKTIDGRGFVTTLAFDDCFGSPNGNATINSAPLELSSQSQASYAFATSATNHLGQMAYTQFEYYLGWPVEIQDANGIVSSGYFNDVLDRPTQVVAAVNNATVKSQTTFSYDDTNRVVTSTSDLNTYGDNVLKTQSLYDNLGRTFETRQYEGGTNYIVTKREYDALGRAYRISNPYRPWQSESPVWMTTTFDALGRTLTATTADNAVVTTSYNGNTVTATDQAGKARKGVNDALGRVKEIYEDPSSANYLTSYAYDVLDNLTTVTQGVQTRTFAYDSLKRLTSATNSESGTTSYTYDNNGNVTQRVDARSITTTIAYDALNRPTAKTYSDATPRNDFYYDAQTLPGGAPSFDRGFSVGALVAITYGGGSAGTYRGYDAAGRVARQYQQTDAVNYLTEATYFAGGGVQTETYPSVPGSGDRRTVSYTNDSAGRLASLNSSATSYAAAASVSSISYASHNGLSSETYGNNLVHAITYNNRLQPNEIKLGTSGNPTSIVSLVYSYGTTNNNGNVLSVAYSGGGLSYTQTFGYDALNRLTTSLENGGTSWSQTNAYDRYGNRSIVGGGLSFNAGDNRITGWSYDAAGNLLNDGLHGYTFDAENKIKNVDGNAAYTYDAEGQRVKKLVGENVRFVYGIDGKLVAEFDGSTGNLKKEYISGGATLITIVPTAVNGNGAQYTLADNLGSPRVITNASAAVVSRHDYMPFGEELGSGVGGRTTGMGFSSGGDTNRKKFTQYERDNETGLDYAQARYFSSTQGRFTSPDPLMASAKSVDPQSWNRYSYVGNNPMVFADPSGLQRGPGSFYANNPEIQHAQEVGSMEVEASEVYYEDRLDGEYDSIVATGEPIDGALEEQQTLVQDDPETIRGESNTNDCTLTVSFKLGTIYENNKNWPNGVSEVNKGGIAYLGLGFTWSGTVKGGNGVGQIGYYQNPENPNGQWKMEQWTSSYATSGGEILVIQGRRQSGGQAWMDIDLNGIHSAPKNSSKFSRYDHPSIRGDDLYKNQSFFVKVSNGNKACYAAFHIVQRGNTIHWGRGAMGMWPK
jgi:RHS repeat-associated protein